MTTPCPNEPGRLAYATRHGIIWPKRWYAEHDRCSNHPAIDRKISGGHNSRPARLPPTMSGRHPACPGQAVAPIRTRRPGPIGRMDARRRQWIALAHAHPFRRALLCLSVRMPGATARPRRSAWGGNIRFPHRAGPSSGHGTRILAACRHASHVRLMRPHRLQDPARRFAKLVPYRSSSDRCPSWCSSC